MSDTYNAAQHVVTKQFMQELFSLCRKWNVMPAPTYGGEISFHDSMRLILFDEDAQEFLMKRTGFNPEDLKR